STDRFPARLRLLHEEPGLASGRGQSGPMMALALRPRSVRIDSADDCTHGPGKYHQVQPGRPVRDVVEIAVHALLHLLASGSLTAKSVYLRPPGQARFHTMPLHVAIDYLGIAVIQPHRMRARTDQGHCPAEDIEELRQFVQAPAPQESADCRNPAVVGGRL